MHTKRYIQTRPAKQGALKKVVAAGAIDKVPAIPEAAYAAISGDSKAGNLI